MTCAATMVTASHWVGSTLPGMIDEPGSFSGKCSSPNPVRGPFTHEADVVGDLAQRHRQHVECARQLDQRVIKPPAPSNLSAASV